MQIAVPDDALGAIRLTETEARLHLAVGMYAENKVTLGQAARIAGISSPQMLRELGKREIPFHYGEADLARDIESVKRFRRQK